MKIRKAIMKNMAIAAAARWAAWTMVLATLFCPAALGQYEIGWSTIDGGGGRTSGGRYVLSDTIGQPDAAYSAAGPYEVLAGFWPGTPICVIGFGSFTTFAEQWLHSGADLPADLNHSRTVDFVDLRLFVDQWLQYCPPGWSLR
jgi:hypothetical protein